VRTVTFQVFGNAAPKGSMNAFMRPGMRFPVVTHGNRRTKDWQHAVADAAQRVALDGLFSGPVTLRVTFALPRPKSLPRRITHHTKMPDLDKLVRCVNDALTGVLYRDDAQVETLEARKVYAQDPEPPHALITLEETAPTATTLPLLL
jgi:Holliday junction resolvase RusA-like endonuclease